MRRLFLVFITVLACLLLLSCAPQQVEGKAAKVELSGVTTECKYTGSYQFKPVGEGIYSFTTGDDVWTFTGVINKDNSLTDGSVENMPYAFKNNGKHYETYYTGEVRNLLPQSEIPITEFAFLLKYDGNEMQGNYTGTLLNELPDGQGSFSYENKGEYFEYTGTWLTGKPSGEGHIESNCFVVHFDDVDREGEFKGDVVDGIPCGEGSFSATNDENISYVYTGEWEDGLYNGQGKLVYDSSEYYVREGKFTDAEFTPSLTDFYLSLGSIKDSRFNISGTEADFIKSHGSIFDGEIKEIDDSFIDSTFKYETFSKDQSKFDCSIIKASGLRVIQVYEEEIFGYHHVFIIADDSKYRVYYINLIGTAPDIFENSRIQITTMPVDYFTYPNVAGTKVWAIACIGICVTKQ